VKLDSDGLKRIYLNNPNITIKWCSEELPQTPEEHPNFWNIWVDVAKRYGPSDLDVLFTSELYGEPYSQHLGIKHHLVDLDRKTIPVSGTKIRSNPFKYWQYIPEQIRYFFVKKIAHPWA
jgi:HTH-type transcriptional repressor of NAD biosynthesis genes